MLSRAEAAEERGEECSRVCPLLARRSARLPLASLSA
jgi:hypothetical protein